MEEFKLALWVQAAALVTLLGFKAREALGEWIDTLRQQRLASAGSRIAGEIVARIAADPDKQAATPDDIAQGAQLLRERLPDASKAQTEVTLKGIVAGELGKQGGLLQ